ncbi:energy-coupling factor ABC transporter ATP-binding protein [Miniphocaeibacter halophilus]|uniref:ATP-binding cassette domain-containing protein n=1 Tax=Miniphocaeibacter halophilus TaxID=2931922 RepID=A0AC61MMT4_9FIRM|nr:ATP-binding cassette domain-containing protein [Miniphocaeibacter halophilus]QQK06954.1 ATP-binding cassette domain-containing protein [Miniphocaeibacter halophilus]
MNTNKSIVKVKNLEFEYPDGTKALKNISLNLKDGDFIALIGTNGCGKTTFSKCLNGILKATKGKVIVNGIDVVKSKDPSELVKNVGYVFQNPDHQLFNNRVYDEIAYAPRNIGLNESEIDKRVITAAKIAGVSKDLFNEHPFFLARGLRQRVAIASILSLQPKIIIVDEPTTGQDYKQSIEIMEFLKMLNEEHGHTIIIITHDMDIVAEYAKWLVVMHQGEIIIEGTLKDVYSETKKLEKASLKPPQVTRIAQSLSKYGFKKDIINVEEFYTEFRGLYE